MKVRLLALFALLGLLFGQAVSQAHGGEDDRISIEAETQGALTASERIPFSFQIYDEETKKAVTHADLQLSHTKKVHLIVYDASLNEFNHLHPEFVGGLWEAELNLTVNGSYFIWAQGVLADGTDFSASYRVNVVSGKPALPVIKLGDVRKGTFEHTTVELSKQKIRAGKMAMVTYTVTRDDGTPSEVTPYLGANAHIIAVSPDGDDLIHVHPMEGQDANSGMIHATFPREGDYRLWIQLIDKNELKTIPLSVTVVK